VTQIWHSLDLTVDCAIAVDQVAQKLEQAGLQVTRSFDLQMARSTHSHCTCPHHGTERCDCQMVVLLVYGKTGRPATLVAHGRDGVTQVSLVNTPALRPEASLEDAIRRAFYLLRSPSEGVFSYAT
jgi:hypothetical protein